MKDLFPPHECGLHLSHNEYKDSYYTLEQALADTDEFYTWIEGEREKFLETGELWTLQWYPDTPVGFHALAASSIDVLLATAKAYGGQEE